MESLIVFAKAPVEGKVKTRLGADTPLSTSQICRLYNAFLQDTLRTASLCKGRRIFLNFTPPGSADMMETLALKSIPRNRLAIFPQEGDSFHARIGFAFKQARAMGATSCVMIGSDSPTLSPRILDDAFDTLNSRGGAALGPSGEGGLYLIGLSGEIQPDFEKIFGHGAELLNFSRWLREENIPFSLLEEVGDVDVAHDLVSVAAHIVAMENTGNKGSGFPANTARIMDELKITIVRDNGTRSKRVVLGE